MLRVGNDTMSGDRPLQILGTIDTTQAQRIVIQFVSYLLTVVLATYIFKKVQFMRRNPQSKRLSRLITLEASQSQ